MIRSLPSTGTWHECGIIENVEHFGHITKETGMRKRLCDSLFNGELLNYARQKLVPATDHVTTSFLSALIETLAD